jgi:hypothetical protein
MISNSKKTGRKNTNQIVKFNMNDTILDGILFMLDDNKVWVGTMTDLKSNLTKVLGKKRDLPRSPSALRIVLNNVVNRLRVRGVSVRFSRTKDHTRTRYVKFVTR